MQRFEPLSRFLLVLTLLAAQLSAFGVVQAQPADPDPARFAAAIADFAAWDRKNSVPENAIVFVGSSSIRFWDTAEAFPDQRVINRGFGGSHISDINFFYEQVVAPYDPAAVVFYAGDNDIGAGKEPARVLADFRAFAARLRADFPQAELIYLSIKPSKLRWAQWPQMREANRMIAEFAAGQPGMRFVDVATVLLDDAGEPKDVFVEDGLHLQPEGYRLWVEVLAPVLDEL